MDGEGTGLGRPRFSFSEPATTPGTGQETDFSIFVRSSAIWMVQTAAMAVSAWASVTRTAPWDSRWMMVPLLGGAAYPLAVLAFFMGTWSNRLVSGLTASGQTMAYSALITYFNPESAGWAVTEVGVLSVAIVVGMWRARRSLDDPHNDEP